MAQALGELGARIILSARKEEELRSAAAGLQAEGIDASWIAADGSQEADMQRLAEEEAIARLGHIDILINNAGASWGAPAEDHPLKSWDKVMNLNIRGIFMLTQLVGKKSMLPRGRGCIINIASIAGLGGNPEFMKTIAYNTSKGACITYTQRWHRSGARTASGSTPSHQAPLRQRWLRPCLPTVVHKGWPPRCPCAAPATTKTSRALLHCWRQTQASTSPVRSSPLTVASAPSSPHRNTFHGESPCRQPLKTNSRLKN